MARGRDRRKASEALGERRARVVFWPFSLFGNPGGERGVGELHDALAASLGESAEEPGSRQHGIARTTRLEVAELLEVEDYARWRTDLRRRFRRVLARGELPVFIGGNHLVALPIVDVYSEMDARVCIVSFDAHLDAYDLSSSRERLSHGNFLLHVRKGPRLSLVNIGHRDLFLGRAAVEEVFDRVYPAEMLEDGSLERLRGELARYLRRFDHVHVDIDLDVLDPALMRAVGTPVPCGITARELLFLLRAISPSRLAGVSISEYDAGRDPDGAGRQLVVWLVERLLLAHAEGRWT